MRLLVAHLTLLCGLMLCGLTAAAQGTIRGKVVDGTTGEVLLGATIRLVDAAGTIKGGAYTDLEGAYTIKAAAGSYSLIISYISYLNDTISGVAVENGGVVYNETLLLEETRANEEMAVEITATRSEASTVTLYNRKRNAINAIDGVSFDLVQRTGDNNVAGAVQRIVGVTVTEGKYVYVRGLGDRYSKTTLNGAEIPSLDPNQNAVQMDIFPSNLIDNVIVYKNFTPDLPGSFTGGLVDVRTKDYPDRLTLNFSASLSYNPQSNLRDDFLTSPEKGKTDWLGIDDGTRALPDVARELTGKVPSPGDNRDSARNYTIDRFTKSFRTGLAPVDGNSGIDQNYQFSIGNQYTLFGNAFGFVASLSYRSEFTAYNDGFVGRYYNASDAASGQIDPNLTPRLTLASRMGQQDVLWGGLIKISYKLKNHKFSFNYMRNQSGTNTARYMEGLFVAEGADRVLETRVINFVERSLNAYQFQAGHTFGKLKADWIASYATSSQDEPDLRYFSNDYSEILDDEGNIIGRDYSIRLGAYPNPAHFYRTLGENFLDAKLNFELPFKQWNGFDSKLKFGGAYNRRTRDFTEAQYPLYTREAATPYRGDIEAFLAQENLGVVRVDTLGVPRYRLGNIYQEFFSDRNQYTGEQDIWAAYLMTELPLMARLRLITGVRFETTSATIVSQDPTVQPGTLDEADILPVANLIYAIKENMNLRAGYARTLARPSFREFSPFESFDFAGDFVLIGDPNLQRTLIDNADLRWEWFFTPKELISVSVFYKYFANPIEKVYDPLVVNPQFRYRNISAANTYGLELEFKKNFAFVADALENLEVGGNLSLVRSLINIDPVEYAQIVAIDPERPNQRPMFGQSPFAANAEIAYLDKEKTGLQVSLNYNVFGPRISVVGGVSPDVYEQPRGLLNLSVGKSIGDNVSIRLRANNLLNPEYKQTYEYKGVEYLFQNFRLGRSYSVGVTVKL
ncbi:MAG: TonB-dependent receptor [Bacteroidia bacterium]|nr:TonB-dependent receptor [Bacteroidia bacterium]